ncbi:hypothetical protein [Pantoea sp. UYEF8]|uniref:hypothetical protein n=1 Tax=Pantoea sp. UYEF8 TaxID=1756394 RepID=UPI00339A51E2
MIVIDILKSTHMLSITFGVLSAILWLASSRAKGKKVLRGPGFIFDDGSQIDIQELAVSMTAQSALNKRAAFFAALASVCQALGC